MAHWAEIDENNIVLRVTVGDNLDPKGDEGYQWLLDNLGGRWVKTSYNNRIRVRYAGVGMYFDEQRDAFYMPKPDDGNPDWFFNEKTVQWELPPPPIEEIQLDPNWVPNT